MSNPVTLRYVQMRTPRVLVLRAFFEHTLVRRLAASLILFTLSASLILPNLGYPRAIIFDETYYITHAQKYLNDIFFLETHPPLGKLLIAAGERWLHPDALADEFVDVGKIERTWPPDLDITGYRLMPALFGMLNPILVFMILALMLGKDLYALAIALFITLDNALIVQSRAALLDSFLIFFCLASLLVSLYFLRKPTLRLRHVALLAAVWGILEACAANVKLSGAVVLVLVGVYAMRLLSVRQYQRLIFFAAVFVTLFALTYLGLWQVHFAIARLPTPGNDYGITSTQWDILIGKAHFDLLSRFIIQFKDGMVYHFDGSFNAGMLDLSNPNEIGSPWYWWLVGGRAIDYRWETLDGVSYRYVYLLGNPITWMVPLLGVVGGSTLAASNLLFQFPKLGKHRLWLRLLVLLYWAYMVPMIMTTRITYLYHYLLPMIVGVMMFGIVLWHVTGFSTNIRRDVLVVGIVLLVFMFWLYSPLTYSLPLTCEQFRQRALFPAWGLQGWGC